MNSYGQMQTPSRLPSSTLQLPKYRRFLEQFKQQFEKALSRWTNGVFTGAVVADGNWHRISGDPHSREYCLNLEAPNPKGEFRTEFMLQRYESLHPTYRTHDGKIDAELIILARGQPYPERIMRVYDCYVASKEVPKGMVAAIVERIEIIQHHFGLGLDEMKLRLSFRTAHGLIEHIVLKTHSSVMPPGCGTLQPGATVALLFERKGPGVIGRAHV